MTMRTVLVVSALVAGAFRAIPVQEMGRAKPRGGMSMKPAMFIFGALLTLSSTDAWAQPQDVLLG